MNTFKLVFAVGRLRVEKRTSSFTALMSALSSVVSGGQDAAASDAAASSVPYHKLNPAVDVEHLDICHLGHHKYALPPFIVPRSCQWCIAATNDCTTYSAAWRLMEILTTYVACALHVSCEMILSSVVMFSALHFCLHHAAY